MLRGVVNWTMKQRLIVPWRGGTRQRRFCDHCCLQILQREHTSYSTGASLGSVMHIDELLHSSLSLTHNSKYYALWKEEETYV